MGTNKITKKFILSMKSLLILTIFLTYTLSFSAFKLNLKDDETKFGKCLSGVHTAIDSILKHGADAIDGKASTLDKIEVLMRDLADAINDYDVCKATNLMDVLEWFDKQLTPAETQCLASAISFSMAVQTFKDATDHFKALPALLRAADSTFNTCF